MCFKIFLTVDFPSYKLDSQKQLSFSFSVETFKLGNPVFVLVQRVFLC